MDLADSGYCPNRTGKLYNGKSFKEDSRIVLVLAGMIETSDDYVERLKTRAEESNVELLFVNNLVEHSRCTKKQSGWLL